MVICAYPPDPRRGLQVTHCCVYKSGRLSSPQVSLGVLPSTFRETCTACRDALEREIFADDGLYTRICGVELKQTVLKVPDVEEYIVKSSARLQRTTSLRDSSIHTIVFGVGACGLTPTFGILRSRKNAACVVPMPELYTTVGMYTYLTYLVPYYVGFPLTQTTTFPDMYVHPGIPAADRLNSLNGQPQGGGCARSRAST